MIIVSVLTPFKALIILKICSEVIILPGNIPAVDIVPDGAVVAVYEAAVVNGAGVNDPVVVFVLEGGILVPARLLIWLIMSFTLLMMSALY
jgi:hypothetical protein